MTIPWLGACRCRPRCTGGTSRSNLCFTALESRPGGAIDVTGRYKVPLKNSAWLRYVSFDAGAIYKTAGFLQEELALGEHFGVRVGLSLFSRGN